MPTAGSAALVHDALTDVTGIRVGHHQRTGRGWRTGTTVVLTPPGTVGGVDVRGGGPGTRETDLLRPENLVDQVHAVCLTGGSAYGLASASGVMRWLEERDIGFPVGVDGANVVPIVPAAVIYDLGRGGVFGNRPDAEFGYRAAAAARSARPASGSVGAGTGAIAGSLQGGVASASEIVADGITVAALSVVNAAGFVIDPATGLPWEPEGMHLRRPTGAERAALAAAVATARQPLNTTIGVVATDLALSKAECTKFASVAHDGMARAARPAHTLFDGDTIFSLATGTITRPSESTRERAIMLTMVFEAGARCFARATTAAVVEARSLPGGPPAYRDLCPSAFGSRGDR